MDLQLAVAQPGHLPQLPAGEGPGAVGGHEPLRGHQEAPGGRGQLVGGHVQEALGQALGRLDIGRGGFDVGDGGAPGGHLAAGPLVLVGERHGPDEAQ